MKIPKIGVVETPAYIQNEDLYLPVIDIFTFLKIQNTPTPGFDSVSGFFINEQAVYLIDRSLNRIKYQDKIFDLNEGDLVKTESNLYLRSVYFGQVFGLHVAFDFYAMTATLSTDIELPVIREMRMALMRKDLSRLKGELKPDTVIGRRYPLFHFGMADWSVMATEFTNGKKYIYLNLALGAAVAGGEANVALTYSNQQPFDTRRQYYLWHYANNDHKVVRQVMLGKINVTATSSLFAPLLGAVVTNTPTTFRRSFGTYTLSDYTEPGWMVELYVNNVLVDYMKADASGFFSFEVPLVYGTSAITLRLYGPMGEERSREKSISIPFNFLPARKLEYSVSAAMTEELHSNLFSRANVSYGLNRRVTIGGGVEYFSSVLPGSVMPFANFSLRLANSLLISGEYAYGVRFKGVLSYRLPWNIQFEMNYFKYHKDQVAISTTYLEERKVILSVPIRVKRFASLVRMTVDQVFLQRSRNLTAELLISGAAYGVSANFTTNGIFYDPLHPNIYSTLSLGFRIPGGVLLVPQAQYDYTYNHFVSVKVEAEKQVFRRGVIKASFEQNFAINIRNVQVSLRYDLPFAQTGLSALYGSNGSSFVQSARGSLMFDHQSRWVGANNMTNVGKGGLVILPFLDMNVNGKRDPGEPKVSGLNINLTGGRSEFNKRDSTIRIIDLEPYTNYFLDIDRNSFDNVAWQIRKPVISVAIDPNQFKLIEVPVAVYGEGSGMVYLKTVAGLVGLGRIIVSFYRLDSTLAGRTLSEPDGYFSFLGLAPGNYFATIEKEQLNNIRMNVSQESHKFSIVENIEGDLASGLDFILESQGPDTTTVIPQIPPVSGANDGKPALPDNMPVEDLLHLPVADTAMAGPSGYTVEIVKFVNQNDAESILNQVQSLVAQPVSIVFDKGEYHLRIQGVLTADSARRLVDYFKGKGFTGANMLDK